MRTVARGRNDDKSALQESVNHGKQDSTSRSVSIQLTRKGTPPSLAGGRNILDLEPNFHLRKASHPSP